jgi:predicted RNA-binding protein with PIN domain
MAYKTAANTKKCRLFDFDFLKGVCKDFLHTAIKTMFTMKMSLNDTFVAKLFNQVQIIQKRVRTMGCPVY